MAVMNATICHILRGDELLLKFATRGVSVGKWNGPGGKLERGESPQECARREVREETGLTAGRLRDHGTIRFFMNGKRSLNIRVRVFSTSDFAGRIRSTDEGELRWFKAAALPWKEMWDDDRYWVHLMLLGGAFDAKFYYDEKNRVVTEYSIRSRSAGGR